MKSKNTVIIVIVIVLLLIGGYYFFNQSAQNRIPGASTQQGGGVFTSIKDALSRSLTLECTYPDESGNNVTVHIKGGMVHMSGAVQGTESQEFGNFLLRDNKMYMWDSVKKEGIVIAFDPQEMQEAAEGAMEDEDADVSSSQGDSYLQEIEKYKEYCKTATVSDAVFAVPADVKFVDFGQQMEQMQKETEENTGADFEKLMEQYGGQ